MEISSSSEFDVDMYEEALGEPISESRMNGHQVHFPVHNQTLAISKKMEGIKIPTLMSSCTKDVDFEIYHKDKHGNTVGVKIKVSDNGNDRDADNVEQDSPTSSNWDKPDSRDVDYDNQ
jgi:hypothetical protein